MIKIVYLIVGGIIYALGFALFLIPHHIVPGGITGISMILNILFNTPVGIVSIILNIPVFIIGMKVLGISFGFLSAIEIIFTNLLIDFLTLSIKIPSPTDNEILGAIYGGCLLGLGIGLILRGGGSTGGTDIIGRVFNRFTNISVGMWIMIVDSVVITAAGVATNSFELVLLGYLSLFLFSKVVDLVLEGMDYARAVFIISEKSEKITEEVYKKMRRGVTVIDGYSPYTKEKRPVIMCVITKKETIDFKSLINKIDKDAFVILTDIFEVLGRGFRPRI